MNARDNEGNTPLHETFLTDVEEELLKLGADVNARNEDGETPIFTTVDDAAIPLFIEHGADLTIRNNKGETVMDAAKDKGPSSARGSPQSNSEIESALAAGSDGLMSADHRMPALVDCILQQCSVCHSQIFLEFDHSFRRFCQSVRLYFASNGSARRRNILNYPLALLGRIWNRAAAC